MLGGIWWYKDWGVNDHLSMFLITNVKSELRFFWKRMSYLSMKRAVYLINFRGPYNVLIRWSSLEKTRETLTQDNWESIWPKITEKLITCVPLLLAQTDRKVVFEKLNAEIYKYKDICKRTDIDIHICGLKNVTA